MEKIKEYRRTAQEKRSGKAKRYIAFSFCLDKYYRSDVNSSSCALIFTFLANSLMFLIGLK
jgi:hypothetical protein